MTDTMKDGERGKPILFSAPMIRALLAGTKTQTRRVIKPQPMVHPNGAWSWDGRNGRLVGAAGTHVDEGFPESARDWCRIQPGDKLWVREAWAPLSALTHGDPGVQALADRGFYQADNSTVEGEISRWRPSIHMPRWASRLTLIVTDVRVQRIRDITLGDICAEGLASSIYDFKPAQRGFDAWLEVWDGINGAGSWDANPWCAAYTFTVHHQNIDALPLPAARDAASREVGG